MLAEEKIKQVVTGLTDPTATIYLVRNIFQFQMLGSGAVNYLEEMPAIAMWKSLFLSLNAVMKRTFDIFLASVILTSLEMVGITGTVKLTSPGPVLFIQKRFSLNGKPINVLKFQTMTVYKNVENLTAC